MLIGVYLVLGKEVEQKLSLFLFFILPNTADLNPQIRCTISLIKNHPAVQQKLLEKAT